MPRWLVLLLVAAPALLRAQAPDQKPLAFEVATIKPNTSGSGRGGGRLSPGGRVTFVNESLRAIIRDAYGLEVIGGPSWIDTDRWDIAATAPSGQSDARLMMQTLLADRFKLVARLEQQEQPIYALVFSNRDKRLGARIRTSSTDCPITGNSCGTQSGFGTITGTAAELADLTRALSRQLGRKVVDRTALNARFDFTLTWTPDNLPPRAPGTPQDQPVTVNGIGIDPNGPSIFTAIQEQLGLKLESTKGPVDVVVIDRVEEPTPD
jgi:uncharacterized protein (TIGR03435 family)